MNISRRSLLRTTALALPAVALASCASSTVNGVTTFTINLATANAYAQAIENGANMLLAIPLISTGMGAAGVAIVKAAVAGIATAISQLNTTYKGQISFSFTIASEPAALNALVTDANQINGVASGIVTSMGTQITAAEQETIDAIQAVVSTLVALVTGTVGAVQPQMPVSAALTVLGVK